MFHFLLVYLEDVPKNWLNILRNKKFWGVVSITFISLIPFYLFLVPYLQFIEHRQGIVIYDPLLNILPVKDFSTLIFLIIYTSVVIMILYSLRSPWLLLRNIHIFIVLQYLRNICLYFTPLDPSPDIIALHDPVLEALAYNQTPLLKDLFFSGHTATCVVFLIIVKKIKALLLIFVMVTITMIFLLLVQHCHYTVDILGGILFAVISYYIVIGIWEALDLSAYLPYIRDHN